MSESDDVLMLPVEGDGPSRGRDDVGARRDAAGVAGRAAGPPAAGAIPGTELVSLSAEARLATALLLQAQALEGMRHAQSDLLRRLEDGSGGAARRAVEELQDSLSDIQQAQQQTLSQLARARRRASHRVGLAAAAVVLALAGGLWCVHLWNRDLASAVEHTGDRIDDAVGSLDADRAALEASLAGVLQSSGAEQARSVKELADALRATEVELRGQLERAQDERDAALASLAASEKAAAGLGDELADARQSRDQLSAELDRARDERNQHLGETVRLRGQVLDAERRLSELTQSINALTAAQATRAQAPDGSIVTVQPDPESLPARVSRALAASGAGLAQVLEVDAVHDGALTGLLVMLAGEASVTPRVLAAARGCLLAVDGRAVLRLSEVRERDRDDVLESVDVELPDLDPEAWRALGVTPPAGFTPVPQVAAALGALLAPHGYTVVGLRSFDGVTLGDLELRQEDSQGAVLRTLKAARAEVLPVGPELVLQSGTITIAGDERPFFQDECRVALPGCDFGQWLAAIASPSP